MIRIRYSRWDGSQTPLALDAAHRRIGTFPDGTIRVGVSPFNIEADIDALVLAVREALHVVHG